MITANLTDELIRFYEAWDQERQITMRDAWAAYDGEHPDQLLVEDVDDNLKIDYPRLLVDANVMALFGKEPEFATGNDAADQLLEGWAGPESQNLLLTMQKLAINGGVTGTPWYKIDAGEAGAAPRIKVLDPANVSAFTDPDDYEDAWAYLIEWSSVTLDGKRAVRRQIIERTTPVTWLIRDEQAVEKTDPRSGSSAGFSKWRELHPPLTWGYAWPPIGCCQNLPRANEYYGAPDLSAGAIRLSYDLDRVASNTNKILRVHAHPKLVGSGFSADQVKMGPDDMLILPNPEARVSAIELQSDLASSLQFMGKLREAFHETNRLPEVAVGKMESAGQLSGVALQILYGPLVAQIEQKRLTYGPMLQEMLRRVLELQGVTVDQIAITWPEIVPGDPEAERRVATMDEALGASKQTILTKLGYTADEELAASSEEQAASLAAGQQAMMAGNIEGSPYGQG